MITMKTFLRAGEMATTLSVALAFTAAPVLAGSLSGGPAVGTSHSGGPAGTASSTQSRTANDSTARGSSKSEAGKMNAGSSHSESAYKNGTSKSGATTPSPIGLNKKPEEKSKTASENGSKQKKKSATTRKHADPKVVEYKWKGDKLQSRKVLNKHKPGK